MERFRAAHVTASKELKKRKGFRNKVKNLLSAKTSRNEFSARGKLEATEMGVVPVNLTSWRMDPKRMNKNKSVEVQFITDVTSKILELAEAVRPQEDVSHRKDTVPVKLPSENDCEPEIMRSQKSYVEEQDIFATSLPPTSDVIETCQNESEKSVGGSASKPNVKIIKNRKEKKKKSTIVEYSESVHIGLSPDRGEINDISSSCEISNGNDSTVMKKCYVEVQDISATSLPPVSDVMETCQNESEKSVGNSASKPHVEKIRNRKEKKKKSKVVEYSESEHTGLTLDVREMNDVLSPCNISNENDNSINVCITSDNVFTSDSGQVISLLVHDKLTEQCVPSFEVQSHSTGVYDIKPLIVKSVGDNSMKDFISTRLQNVCRIGRREADYVAKMTQIMKEVLSSHDQDCNVSHEVFKNTKSGNVTSTLHDKPLRMNIPQTFVREKLESLSIEENSDCDVSFLRDIFHTHSKAQSMFSTAGGVDTCHTKQSQINIHCVENDRFLLMLKSGDSVYVRGKLTVSVIVGCAEILGYELKPSNEPEKYTIFSPRGVSLLSITSCVSSNMFTSDNDVQLIFANNHLPANLIDSIGESDCILLLEKAESNIVDYLSLHLPNKLFPNILSFAKGKKKYSLAEKKLNCELLPENSEENVKLFCKRDEWDSLSNVILTQNSMKETNCTVICGGKGVGKSTLLRFLINRSLSLHNKILCLDFDLGQAEFTVPGCISAVIIKKPLLGPNFTHLLQPERMVFIGDVNVSNCPTQYLESAKFIIDYCKSQAEFQHIPWFVNTMGFCKGLGVELMMNLLHMLSPTNVIQLHSRSNKRNFPKHLDAEYVRNYKSSLKYTSYINRNLSYELHLIPSAAESKSEGQEAEWGLDSRTMREIVVMSYLSGMTAAPNYSLTELVPYVCGFKDLKLCVSHETINPNSVLSVMNGSFVALCICDKGEMLQPSDPNLPCIMLHAPVCQCLGFGIIRGVDMEERQLYVISPLPEDEIQKVNCLVMGTVQLPSSVVLREATCGIVGHVPYTVIGPGQPTGRLSQKSSYHLQLSSAVEL